MGETLTSNQEPFSPPLPFHEGYYDYDLTPEALEFTPEQSGRLIQAVNRIQSAVSKIAIATQGLFDHPEPATPQIDLPPSESLPPAQPE